MSIGFVVLIVAGLLVLFGVGQRVLDRLRLTDRQALLFIALIIAGGFVPDIAVTDRFAFNIGGALIPLGLCLYLFIKAGTALERARAFAATLVTATAVFLLGRYLPADPADMVIDPMYAYGIAGGLIAYLFGRSRRGAFIAGTLGVMLSDVASAAMVWARGVPQRLVLGGAGGYDAIVIAGFLAVLLSEVIGELLERLSRGAKRPSREFKNGEFVEGEHE